MSEQTLSTPTPVRAARIRDAVRVRLGALPIETVPALIVAGGILLRLVRYSEDRSLWLDESLLALNLTTKSYAALLNPLEFGQGAPVGFLFLEKLAIDTLGDGERALRLFPLLASIAALLLFYPVARRLTTPIAAVMALVLFATLEPFIRYAAEAKPYAFDVLVTLGLIGLFASRLDAAEWRSRDLVALALAGAVAIWFSFPAIFVLAGFGLATVLPVLRDRLWRTLPRLSVVAAAWLASFGASYAVTLRNLGTAAGIPASTGDSRIGGSSGLVKGLYVIFSDPGRMPRTMVGLAALTAFAGTLVLVRRRPRLVLLLASIGAVSLAAGLVDRYPLVGRFILFLVPPAILLVAAGLEALREALRPRLPLVGLAVVALMLVPPAGSAARHVIAPPAREQIEPLLPYLDENWRPGDTLYVYFTTQYAFRYYLECGSCNPRSADFRRRWPIRPLAGTTSQWSPSFVPLTRSVSVGSYGPQPQQLLADIERLRGNPRVWVLVSHPWKLQRESVLGPLDGIGTRLQSMEAGVAGVYLYDLR